MVKSCKATLFPCALMGQNAQACNIHPFQFCLFFVCGSSTFSIVVGFFDESLC